MPYIVNKDAQGVIHDTTCRDAQVREKNPANGRWSPEYVTYAEALAWARLGQRTREPHDCPHCNPVH
jgi:hypothetical protein